MRSELETLAHLGINPAGLESGPDDLLHAPGWRARVYPDSPTRQACSACGRPAEMTRLVPLAGFGPRWVDGCMGCMVAAMKYRAGSVTP